MSQDKPSSIKLFQFDKTSESPEAFLEKASALLERVKAEKDLGAFISVSKNSDLGSRLFKQIKDNGDLKARIVFFDPPMFYELEPGKIDFWLIPLGSEPPFRRGCGACVCPTIKVEDEPPTGPLTAETIFNFKAVLSGGDGDDVVTLKWYVSGGEILSGQDTSSIKVKPYLPFDKNLEATVEIGGLSPICSCPTIATETIRLAP